MLNIEFRRNVCRLKKVGSATVPTLIGICDNQNTAGTVARPTYVNP